MTTMTVLYTRRTGHPLGALTTTVPADPPSLDPSATVQVRIPIPGQAVFVLTQQSNDLAIAVLDAEFADPLQVFGWRVVIVTGPDGQPQRRLDRPSTVQVKATRVGTKLTLEVPRLGNAEHLAFEIRNEDRFLAAGVLFFADTSPQKTDVLVPAEGALAILVEGYPPTFNLPPEEP